MSRRAVGIGLAAAVIALFLGGAWLATVNRPAVDGRLLLPELDAPVTVLRDEYGIPYIFADGEADLFRAQGFVTAQHRLFQMEAYRALVQGRLAEVIGEAGLETDRAMRVIAPARDARRHAALLEASARDFLQWYAEGVNAYVREHADDHPRELRISGFHAAPWTVEDVVAVLHFVHLAQGAHFRTELVMQALIDALGTERAQALLPRNVGPERRQDAPMPQPFGLPPSLRAGLLFDPAALGPPSRLGSNNWAVSAARSATGGAVMANDPHLDGRMLPGLWHPVGLFAPGLRAVGAALPGVPGVLIGRTEHVAFGVTNAYGDTQDLYIERPDPDDADRYLDGGESLPFGWRDEVIRIRDRSRADGYREEHLRVRSTRRGPVITDHALGTAVGGMLSLRSVAAAAPGTQLGLRDMLHARDIDAFDEAVQRLPLLRFNMVFADRHGDVGMRATGRIPIRASGHGNFPKPVMGGDDWPDFIPADEMPGVQRPARGWVASANHDTRAEGFPYHYSSYFAPPYRYEVIATRLAAKEAMTLDDHLALMLDVENRQAAILVPLLVDVLSADPDHAASVRLLREWDYRDDRDSAAAALYQASYQQLVRRYYEERIDDAVLTDAWLQDWYHWQSLFDAEVAAAREDAHHPLRRHVAPAVAAAHEQLAARLGPNPAGWRWGAIHRIRFFSPLRESGFGSAWLGARRFAYPGSGETVRRARTVFGDAGFDVRFHASMRIVADMADERKVLAVVAGGVSERHFAPHRHDQLPVWQEGQLIPWWFDPAAVEANARHRVVLQPSAAR